MVSAALAESCLWGGAWEGVDVGSAHFVLPLFHQPCGYWRSNDSGEMRFSFTVMFILTIAYYREFLLRHTSEIVTQITTGEIDLFGTAVSVDNPIPFVLPLSLLDNIFAFVGAVLVLGLHHRLALQADDGHAPVVEFVPQLVLFSLLSKQQSYYAIPALLPLVLLAGRDQRIALFGVAGGVLTWLSVGVRVGTLAVPGSRSATLPLVMSWAEAPSGAAWPLSELGDALEQQCSIVIFSETQEPL